MVIGIRYGYIDHFDKDEEVYGSSNNMTEMSKWFKKKGGTSSCETERKLQNKKEEALKLQQAEEERKQKEEDEKNKQKRLRSRSKRKRDINRKKKKTD